MNAPSTVFAPSHTSRRPTTTPSFAASSSPSANHAWFAFRPEDAQGLENATAAQLKKIEISPSTFGLHFPLLDAQFDITALMQGHFGSRKWMAARLGAAGGASRSKAKVTASRTNGKLGGRPRKLAAK